MLLLYGNDSSQLPPWKVIVPSSSSSQKKYLAINNTPTNTMAPPNTKPMVQLSIA